MIVSSRFLGLFLCRLIFWLRYFILFTKSFKGFSISETLAMFSGTLFLYYAHLKKNIFFATLCSVYRVKHYVIGSQIGSPTFGRFFSLMQVHFDMQMRFTQ